MNSYNRQQKSWGQIYTFGRRKYNFTCLVTSPTGHPTYNVENYYLQLLLNFNIVLGEEGEQRRAFF